MSNQARVALITGITGQDGSYLAEQLLARGYEVHGLVRRSSVLNRANLDVVRSSSPSADTSLHLHYGDVSDGARVSALLAEIHPHEIYNLAAQSHVRVSIDEPVHTTLTTGVGALNVLEAVRVVSPDSRVFQAGSSECFAASESPVDESSVFHPRNPYGAARAFTHWITNVYREMYGIYAVSGLMFNHESPRRGESFVTRKIARGVAAIARGEQDSIELGNLDAARDWGYAPEFTDAMWRSLQVDQPWDYVLCTGVLTSLREFLAAAFSAVDLDWSDFVTTNPRFTRPADETVILGSSARAAEILGWSAEVYGTELARVMVEAELTESRISPVAGM